MVAGFAQTSHDVITSIKASGDVVKLRMLAYDTAGTVQTYALSYFVSGNFIVTGATTR